MEGEQERKGNGNGGERERAEGKQQMAAGSAGGGGDRPTLPTANLVAQSSVGGSVFDRPNGLLRPPPPTTTAFGASADTAMFPNRKCWPEGNSVLTWPLLAAALVAAPVLPERRHAARSAVPRGRGEAAGGDLARAAPGEARGLRVEPATSELALKGTLR